MRRALILVCVAGAAACDPGGWKSLDTGTDVTLRSVFVEAENRVWISGDQGTVLFFDGERFTDSSTSAGFRGIEVPDWYGVAASAGETAIAGDRGLAYARRETIWEQERSNTSERMLTMIRPAPSMFYAAGENGRVIRRRVGDKEWQRVDINAPRESKITGGWSNSEETIAFATDRGIVIEQVQGEWIASTVDTSTTTMVPLFGVWSSTRGADLVAVGLAGVAYRRPEGAVAWSYEDTGSDADLYAIYGSAADRVFAVGGSGVVLQYDGAKWTSVPSASPHDLYAIHGLADGSLTVAAGDRGTVVILEE